MLEKGTIVFGNWTIEGKIGSGAFGTVYKIKREEFGKVYYSAMKVLQIPQDKDEYKRLKSEGMDDASISTYYSQVVQDFISEIELLSSLDGITNIVDYKDHIIETNGDMGYIIYIKMQLLTPLSDVLLNSDGSVRFMDVEEVIKLGKDMCSALKVCEKRNIIHRDIKIDNIFFSENGDYKLGDFGIAKQLEATQGEMSQKGTLLYMAPEVFKGEKYDKTADIYSLGMVLYRLLNKNRAPFFPNYPDPIRFSDKETANIKRLKGEKIPDIIDISTELNAVLKKACAFNSKDRYKSASEFKAALKNINVDVAVQSFDEITNDFDEPVFEETSYKEDTVSAFTGVTAVIVENNVINEDKTESIFNLTPVISKTTTDESIITSLKKEEQAKEIASVKTNEVTKVDETVLPVVNIEDNQSLIKGNEIEDESTTEKLPKNNKSTNKKPLVISLCAIVVVLSIFLGVIFIPDWNDDIPIDTNITVEEQVNDGYIFADDETDFSEDGEEYISDEDLINSDEESDDNPIDEGTTKKTTSSSTPQCPNLIGLKEDEAVKIARTFEIENDLNTIDDEIYVYYFYNDNMPEGYVFEYSADYNKSNNYYDDISICVSMGDGEKAWSTLSETINVPTGYTPTGYGSPYEVYSKSGCDDIEVEELGPYERKRVIYKDSTGNVVKTEAWSEWKESDVYYPYDEGEEYIGYDESTGYTKYYETQKNKAFYRWRYCETYH